MTQHLNSPCRTVPGTVAQCKGATVPSVPLKGHGTLARSPLPARHLSVSSARHGRSCLLTGPLMKQRDVQRHRCVQLF
jgi:hypothetical protein